MKNDRNIQRYPHTPVSEGPLCQGDWIVEEKLDGANCAVGLSFDGEFVARSRNHPIFKGKAFKGAAKRQFLPLWQWLSKNKRGFEALNDAACGEVFVFGEWMWFVHGVEYEALSSPFMPFAVAAPGSGDFFDPFLARSLLEGAGLPVAPLILTAKGGTDLAGLAAGASAFGPVREGVVAKRGNGQIMTAMTKSIAPGYAQNSKWDPENPKRQHILKP